MQENFSPWTYNHVILYKYLEYCMVDTYIFTKNKPTSTHISKLNLKPAKDQLTF